MLNLLELNERVQMLKITKDVIITKLTHEHIEIYTKILFSYITNKVK